MASNVVYSIILILAVIVADLFCGSAVNGAWNTSNNTQYASSSPHFSQKSTTPWPVLGQRSQQHNTGLSNAKREPMWVRPNNGTIWVRNNQQSGQLGQNSGTGTSINLSNENRPSSTQNQAHHSQISGQKAQTNQNRGSTNNYNTHFINSERNVGSSFLPSNKSAQNTLLDALIVGNKGSQPDQSSQVTNNSNNKGTSSKQSTGFKGEENANEDTGTKQADSNVEDYELREFSEELLGKDVNNPNRHVVVNLQGVTTSRSSKDEAPLPLLSINQAVYEMPSVSKLVALFNNYILEANQNEVSTPQEKIEENDLLDNILPTPVMQHTRNFLIKKGKIGKDPKDFKDLMRLIWFNMYSRGSGRIGSSGFEHVFLAELKNNQVSGLHNWLYFSEEEKRNNANYLGYMKKVDLGNKGSVLKYHFVFHNVDKPVGSMFIGTSPELEMALYTTCFVLRADKICPLKMNGNRFIIRTYTYRYRGKNMIGSAFPEI
nr:unnamed protein product [Callosobruchus analis]